MFYVNQVLSWNNELHRVLHLKDGRACLIKLNPKVESYRETTLQSMQQALEQGDLKPAQDPYESFTRREVSGNMALMRDQNYNLIKSVVADTNVLFSKDLRVIAMRAASEGKEGRLRRIRRLIGAWWRKGQCVNALIPDYGKNKGKTFEGRPMGRISHNGTRKLSLTEALKKEIDMIMRKYVFAGENSISVSKAYKHFLIHFQKMTGKSAEDAPSEHQFRAYYNRHYTTAEKIRGRTSVLAYSKDFRSLKGSIYDVVCAPGSIYEIDSTTDNVYLVRESDRRETAARPTLYLVVDVYTGMIAGFNVSLNDASYRSAGDALYCACRNKVDVCAEYGIQIDLQDWPIQGLPSKIVADNGELRSDQIERLSQMCGTAVGLTSSYRADQKGTVEKSIGMVQDTLKQFMMGLVDSRKLKKEGAQDRRDQAVLTLNEYTKMVIWAILSSNRHIRECVPPKMPATIRPTPLGLWQWSQESGNSELRTVNTDLALRLALMKREKCTFSREGINVGGIRYLCEKAAEMGYFDRHRWASRPKNMQIVIDPSNVSAAYLYPDVDHDPSTFWICRLAPKSQQLQGLTRSQAEEYMRQAKGVLQQARQEEQIYGARVTEELTDISDNAKKQKPEDKRTHAQIVSAIKDNRKKERDVQEAAHPRITLPVDSLSEEKTTVDQKQEKVQSASSEPKPGAYPTSFDDIYD